MFFCRRVIEIEQLIRIENYQRFKESKLTYKTCQRRAGLRPLAFLAVALLSFGRTLFVIKDKDYEYLSD